MADDLVVDDNRCGICEMRTRGSKTLVSDARQRRTSSTIYPDAEASERRNSIAAVRRIGLVSAGSIGVTFMRIEGRRGDG